MASFATVVCTMFGVMCPSQAPAPPPAEPAELPQNYYELEEPPAPKPKPTPPPPPPGQLVAPPSVDFGRVEVDAGDRVETVLLRNDGGQVLTLNFVEVSGTGAFQHGGSCPQIAAGDVCGVPVAFSPQRGGSYVGTLLVGTGGDVTRIELRGQGVSPPPPEKPKPRPKPAPVVEVDPARQAALARAHAVLAEELVRPVAVSPAPEPPSASEIVSKAPIVPKWHLGSPEYDGSKAEGEYPGDVSTYRVERCRILSGDDFVPLVLDQTLNTQITGRIMAHTDRDIYGPDGRLVLIPRGTKFRGSFEPLSQQGDTRVKAQWERLTRPDGAAIQLTATTAADAMGRSGLTGVVDNRFFEKYGTVIAATAIGATVAYATQSQPDSTTTASDGTFTAAGQALNQSLAQVTAEALRNAANLAPRVTVPKGTLVYAIPGQDWYFPNPYQVVEMGEAPKNVSYECSDDFFKDPRGIAQNPENENVR